MTLFKEKCTALANTLILVDKYVRSVKYEDIFIKESIN